MIKKFYLNPFILYALSWGGVFVVYNLGWSDMYPPLSTELTLFFCITIFITFSCGWILSYCNIFTYSPLKSNLQQVKKLTKIYLVLNIFEILYSRHIPLLLILEGVHYDERPYGLPLFHPLIIAMGIFLGLYIFQMMCSDKNERKALLPYFILSFAAILIIYGRGLMFLTFFGCALIYVITKKIRIINYVILFFVSIGILFLFGLAGNIRIGATGIKINLVGQASAKFENIEIPNEFLWSYLYFSSPMANLEYNTQIHKVYRIDEENVAKLIMTEMVPSFISKFGQNNKVEPYLINSALNVSSIYARPYVIAGWPGMWMMFSYIMVFIFLVINIITRRSPYFIVTIVILNMLMVGNVFDNMMNYVLPYVIFFPVLLELKRSKTLREKII